MKKLLAWLEFRICIWSMRPAPKSPEGQAWVEGARWGVESVLDHLDPEVKAALDAFDNLNHYGVRIQHHRDLDAIRALLTKLTEVTDETRQGECEHLRDCGTGEDCAG